MVFLLSHLWFGGRRFNPGTMGSSEEEECKHPTILLTLRPRTTNSRKTGTMEIFHWPNDDIDQVIIEKTYEDVQKLV